MNQVIWTSSGGHRYPFEVCRYEGAWKAIAGVYMFCELTPDGVWRPLYIGQCLSYRDRMCGHDQWGPAVRKGATRVLAMPIADAKMRDAVEALLIRELHPPLNVQLRVPRGFNPLG